MPVSWAIAEGLVLLKSDENATFEEWETAVDSALRDPAVVPGMGIVHDLRRLVRVPTVPEAAARAKVVETRSKALSLRRWAVVVTPGVQFGMARMAEAFTELVDVEFRAFTDPLEARDWASGLG